MKCQYANVSDFTGFHRSRCSKTASKTAMTTPEAVEVHVCGTHKRMMDGRTMIKMHSPLNWFVSQVIRDREQAEWPD